MAKQTTVEVPVTVTLPKADYDKLVAMIPGDDFAPRKIQNIANGLFEDMSAGGLMLSGEDTSRLADSLETVDAASIIEAVEAGSGMDEGQMVVKWRVDQTLVGPLQEVADSQGVTINEVTQNLMDNAVNDGWFYDFNPKPHCLFIANEDHANLAALLNKEHVTGEDVIDLLVQRGILAGPEEPETSITDILGSTLEPEAEAVEA